MSMNEYTYAAWNCTTFSASIATFINVAAVRTIKLLSSPTRSTPTPSVRSLADFSSRRSVYSVSNHPLDIPMVVLKLAYLEHR